MKRGAEKQLSKDEDRSDDEQGSDAPVQGFKKADESVLARRPIRALPKRVGASPTPTPPSPDVSSGGSEPTPAPKFSGFAGFGAPSSGPSPFSFSPPTSTKMEQPTSTSTSSGALFSSQPGNPSLSAFPGAPAISPSASSATKTFASLLGSSLAPPQSTVSKTISPASGEKVDPAALNYYSSLRGLNISFLSALSKAVDEDPFADVADVLERYKSLRLSVQKDFDDKSKSDKATGNAQQSFDAQASKPASSSNLLDGPPPPNSTAPLPKPAAMPAPPTSFAGFGHIPNTSKSPSPAITADFIQKTDSSIQPSTSSFTAASTSTSSTSSPALAKATFSFGADTSKPSTFGTSSADSANKSSSAFGGVSSSTSTDSPFGSSIFGKGPSAFSSNLFGSSTTEDKEKGKDIATSKSPSTTNSLFGSPTTSAFSTLDKPPQSPFSGGFGSKPSPFGAFGAKSGGSIGNPVGFGFGSPPKTPEETNSSSSKSVGFSFGVPPRDNSTEGEGTLSPTEEGAADNAEDGSNLLPTKAHDEEGEGEEDEVTTYSAKTKVYKMVKGKDGEAKWGDMGIGMLRLKKHKETDARRVLLRNSGTGKITINFNIYAGLSPSLTSKVVSFVGHEEGGAAATYKLRLKTDAQAAELKSALEREIGFVKGKSE